MGTLIDLNVVVKEVMLAGSARSAVPPLPLNGCAAQTRYTPPP